MIEIIRTLLKQLIDDIDSGSSNIGEEEQEDIIKLLKTYTRKDTPISKYQAYTYLGMSRASFDNFVKVGKFPKGIKRTGFKELVWYKKDLDDCIKNGKQ